MTPQPPWPRPMTPTPTPLSDDELAAYAEWADAECDSPLAAMVAELRRRRASPPWAVIVLAPGHAALVSHLIAATDAPLLIVAPVGTRLPRLNVDARAACTLDTYDPDTPTELRDRLRAHGLCG